LRARGRSKKNKADTDKAVRTARKAARKKHQTVKPETLTACGYTFVFTTLSAEEANAELILALYRFRWQVEMAFKLLKSQLHLDKIRAHDPDLARSYLLAKLLGAILLEDLTGRWVSLAPEDNEADYPLSRWRLWAALWRTLIAALELFVSLSDWMKKKALYSNLYRDTPRKRKKQALDQILDCSMPRQND
jgi:hypothetical protein